jgi:hypothetical protein
LALLGFAWLQLASIGFALLGFTWLCLALLYFKKERKKAPIGPLNC